MEIRLTLRDAKTDPPEDHTQVLAICQNPITHDLFHVDTVSGYRAKIWAKEQYTVLYVPMDEMRKEIVT